MNFEQARANMVEQQIRPWEVLDQEVLDLLYAVPREDFVPAACRSLAFADMEIPIGEGEKMMAPKVEARLVQELALRKTWEAVPAPKLVIAVGACAISGGPFVDHPEVNNGAAGVVPVDLFIPGCPPHPLTILDGLLRLLDRLENSDKAV